MTCDFLGRQDIIIIFQWIFRHVALLKAILHVIMKGNMHVYNSSPSHNSNIDENSYYVEFICFVYHIIPLIVSKDRKVI